jgi:glycosyltransferase involved in cell wall biosynthesis
MTRIDHLGAFIEQGGASGENPGAPLVFWDGYGLDNPHSGIARYARRLADALKREGTQPIVLGNDESCHAFRDLPHFSHVHEGSFRKLRELKIVWPQVTGAFLEDSLTGASLVGRRAILHGLSNFNIPVWPKIRRFKRVLTVHDIIPLLEPNAVSRGYYLQFRAILHRALSLADGVVCVSNWTRDTLLERYPDAERKIYVIRNGIEEVGQDLSSRDFQLRRALRPQFICVSRYEKYKRLELLIDILDALPIEWQGVVVTDRKGERILRPLVSEMRREVSLKIVTGVSDTELRHLYQTSHVYIHPSLFEGFCLPVAEAILAGLPVVFQKGSAIEELVSSDVGCGLGKGSNGQEWAHAALSVLGTQESPGWSETISKHLKILPTWEVGAQTLKNLYNNLS